MTVAEKKLQILVNMNQMVVTALIDQLAAISVENDELKAPKDPAPAPPPSTD